ncbi:MAG: hypothetical protein PVSMB8_05790 [Vulcanimicrobiaceae bacterium]
MFRSATVRLLPVVFVTVAALAGCSGGGGGSAPPVSAPAQPIVDPVKPPVPSPAAAAGLACTSGAGLAGATTVNVDSIPRGLGVTVQAGSTTQPAATTPTSVTPQVCSFQTLISITPSNGNPAYRFAVDQHLSGARTFLYDQAADTSGSIGSVSTFASARSLDASRRVAQADGAQAGPRRFSLGALGQPHESATRVVVRYRTSALRTRTASAIEAGEGITRGDEVGPQGDVLTRVIDVPTGRTSADVAARLRARSEVAFAAPERLYYKEATAAVGVSDTHFDSYQQWSLSTIGAPNAWGYTHGSRAISVAIVDTGADFNHQDLGGGKITFAESILNGAINPGVNPATGANFAQDTDGHGTNVAGIAAAQTNNGFGFAGVGFDTSLQIYKVFSDGTAANQYATSANSSDVSKAIYEAVAHGANVINLSLGTCQVAGADPMQRDAIAFAISRNVTVVAAAGNERGGASSDPNCPGGATTVDFPAAYDGVIAVGASKYDDTAAPMTFSPLNREAVASYSNAGPGLTLVAPGGDPSLADQNATSADLLHWIAGLYSTTAADPGAQCRNKADCRALFAGTSQATPHVAGTVALMLARNPGLSPATIKSILSNTADDLGDPNQGAGRLDAYRALAAVTSDSAPPKVPTNANFVAFAYTPDGTNVPKIVDVTYPTGVRVASDGTFRIADIPQAAANYKIGVWYDANGDGIVDAGDYFGTSATTCSATASCTAAATGIVARPVAAGFVLN